MNNLEPYTDEQLTEIRRLMAGMEVATCELVLLFPPGVLIKALPGHSYCVPHQDGGLAQVVSYCDAQPGDDGHGPLLGVEGRDIIGMPVHTYVDPEKAERADEVSGMKLKQLAAVVAERKMHAAESTT
jgi:hypothetical protein